MHKVTAIVGTVITIGCLVEIMSVFSQNYSILNSLYGAISLYVMILVGLPLIGIAFFKKRKISDKNPFNS